MADLSITAANVHVYDNDTTIQLVEFAATMTAGQSAYRNADGAWNLADADNSDETAGSNELGIVIVGAAPNQYGLVATGTGGAVDLGATLTVGAAYIVSETAGGIAPATDYAGYSSPTRLSILGVASDTNRLELAVNAVAATK